MVRIQRFQSVSYIHKRHGRVIANSIGYEFSDDSQIRQTKIVSNPTVIRRESQNARQASESFHIYTIEPLQGVIPRICVIKNFCSVTHFTPLK